MGNYVPKMTHEQRRVRRINIALYIKSGHTKSEAAQKFKCSYAVVDMACTENGITAPIEPRKGRDGWSFANVLARLINGTSRTDVCAKVGVSRQYVSQVVQQAETHGLVSAIEKFSGKKLNI